MISDRAGNNIGEESDIKAVVKEIVTESPLAIDISQPGNLHEGVKTDADGQQNIKRLNLSCKNGIDVVQKKVAVFEKSQKENIGGNRGDKDHFFVSRASFHCQGKGRPGSIIK